MARPSKLNADVQARLVKAITAGSYLESAAQYAGVSYPTFRNWMIRGERASAGPYREFFEAITRAEAEAKVSALEIWRSAFSEDWRAVAMWLERRYPDEWGRKDRVTVQTMLEKEAEKISKDLGLNKDEVMAAAQAILAGSD